VSVYRDKIVLEKAGDEYGIVFDPLLAETLFNNLESAQALVQRIPDETDPDTFFTETEPGYFESAGLDAALEETHPDPLIEEDAELIQEVCGEEEPTFVEEEVQRHVEKVNKNASAEAVQVKEEYKPQKSKASQDELAKSALIGRSALSRLKSLQGRVLTIMDAAIADKAQRDAVKTLINKEFRRDITKINGDGSESDE
jgi:transketolase